MSAVAILRPPPPLQSGDRLSADEFHARYLAHPEIKKAELVEGIVFVTSPVTVDHATPHATAVVWLGVYSAATPGTSVQDNVTVRLGPADTVQPDVLLRRLDGACQLEPDGYLAGPPELVVEIAASSASYDLHAKRQLYARAGVPEYVVILVYEQSVLWLQLHHNRYEPVASPDDAIFRSGQFPGLWLDVSALLAGDLPRLLDTLQRGLATR